MLSDEEIKQTATPMPLVEGVDYYIEKGLFVLTEHFLLKRGHCCGSGCRHCPYRKKKGKKVES
ncbi:MAG: hypothetical protein KIS77_06620 [Saprospiraceae bacterium]|nr:hypothetical protein [Saprospiraceae bacterium]